MSTSINYRPEIDGLRAIAVLSVLLYHIDASLLPGGFLGVDIFFVISGYLISLIVFREQAAGSFSFGNFYARRILRLFPALVIVLYATLGFGAFALYADEYELLGKHASSAIIFMLNFQLMGEAGYFDVASHAKPLMHLWSLSVEEQFYVVWPPIMLIAFGWLGLHCRWVIGSLLIASFAFAIRLASWDIDTLYFHPLARFWELLVGAAIACWHHKRGINNLPSWLDNLRTRNVLSMLGLALVAIAILCLNDTIIHPGWLTTVPVLGVVAIITSGSKTLGNRILSLPMLVWIGLISYPLYLWHWPVLSYIRIMESGTPQQCLLWAGAVLALALAAFTFRYIEQPLRHRALVRPKLMGLITAMMVLLVISRIVVTSDGLPNRSSVRYVQTAEAQMKREPGQDEFCIRRFSTGQAPVYCREMPVTAHARMIAIIGDSHAHALYPGVAELAAKLGYGTLLLANSGCPPLDGTVVGRNPVEKAKCAAAIDVILKEIEREPRVDTVLIATRGPIYLTGSGYGPAESNYAHPPISSDVDKHHAQTPVEIFSTGLANTLARLRSHGKSVAYLLQVPELGVPARNCLGRPLSILDTTTCSVTLDEYMARMSEYRNAVKRLQHAGLLPKLVDPAPLFCIQGICSGIRSKQLLYADDDHLSVQGSRVLAPYIIQALGLEQIDP